MQTIFVTGAEGFAGTYLTRHLKQRGFTVVGGVRNRARKLAFEKQYGKALVCDVSDAINVARVIASVKPDGIIHLAGTSRAFAAEVEPLVAYQSSVSSWANVLDAVRRTVPRARVVMVSAAEVYGESGNDGQPLKECSLPKPTGTLGALKVAAESIAHTFHHNYHVDVLIARPFQYIGSGQPESSFFGMAAKRVAEWDPSAHGNTIHFPDLDCRRDVLHVADVVEAYECILRNGKPNEVYNVCSGKAVTCRELIGHMIRGAGLSLEIAEQRSEAGPNPVTCQIGSNDRLREGCSWEPTRSLEQSARELVLSFQSPGIAVGR